MSDWMWFVVIVLGLLLGTTCFLNWNNNRDLTKFYKNLPKLPPVPELKPIPYMDHNWPKPEPVPGCRCGCNEPGEQPDKVQKILREELHDDTQDNPEGDGEVRH